MSNQALLAMYKFKFRAARRGSIERDYAYMFLRQFASRVISLGC